MKIIVKVFGRYKEIIGTDTIELTATQGATIWDIVEQLSAQYPQLEKEKKFFMVSQNNIYTTLDAPLNEGDEITLSPPIVGGG